MKKQYEGQIISSLLIQLLEVHIHDILCLYIWQYNQLKWLKIHFFKENDLMIAQHKGIVKYHALHKYKKTSHFSVD